MNKTELVAAIVAKTGVTKKVAEANLNATIEAITEALVKFLKLVGIILIEHPGVKHMSTLNEQFEPLKSSYLNTLLFPLLLLTNK